MTPCCRPQPKGSSQTCICTYNWVHMRSIPACVCGRLRRAARALTQMYDDTMAPCGLRITQFSLLRTLSREGPMRITALAAATLLDRTALSRNLEPLVAQGLVKIAP